jgi:NAD+ synthase (glutamine-hydrolysing)
MALRIGLAQINSSVGDIAGNVAKIKAFYDEASEFGVDLVVFPEMAICGYPPEDLLLKKHFLSDNQTAIQTLAEHCGQAVMVVGFAEAARDGYFNALAILQKGSIRKTYRKIILPNYGVFDERRYFRPGRGTTTAVIRGHVMVPTICEDIWHIDWIDQFIGEIFRKDLIVNISASPFHMGKVGQRRDILSRCATHFNCPVAYCNLVGGQDELVFDGCSMFTDTQGNIVCQAKAFEEDLLIADLDVAPGGESVGFRPVEGVGRPRPENPSAKPGRRADRIGDVYQALVLGTRDYVRKNGFQKVVIGMSGGIDSALTAAIAVDALGPENVIGVTMPTKFNTRGTVRDAGKTARNLGMEFHTIPIADVLDEFDGALKTVKNASHAGIAHENLQARIRGTILMYLSNDLSCLVLTTSNKSETAVGFATLYGDTAGGFAVIKDVPKTKVYQLARYVNRVHGRTVIPTSVLNRPPSAELRADQLDTDSLPDYELLDRILKGYIEEDRSAKELEDEGLPADVVHKVSRMVDFNEYKRRQSPPGVKITPKAFGKDRRMPITNRYKST